MTTTRPTRATPDTVTHDGHPWRSTAVATDDRGRTWQVRVEWRLHQGRYEPLDISVRALGPAPVSAQVLRELPIGSITTELRSHIAKRMAGLATAGRIEWTFIEWTLSDGQLSAHEVLDAQRPAEAIDTARRFGVQRGRRLGPEILGEVAGAYRAAWAEGRPVQRAVADETGCSVSMAGKRIMAARKAGLLDGIGG